MDGELYLRLLLEECLTDPARGGFHTAAHALVSVGALPFEAAQGLVADFELACELRGESAPRTPGSAYVFGRRPVAEPEVATQPAGFDPVGIAVGPATLEVPDGRVTVNWITTGPGGQLNGSLVMDPDAPPFVVGHLLRMQSGHPAAAASPDPWMNLAIVDDRGQTYQFGGGSSSSSDTSYTFEMDLTPPPPAGAKWFEVTYPEGHRVRLALVPADNRPRPIAGVGPRSRSELFLLHSLQANVAATLHGGGRPPGQLMDAQTADIANALIGAGLLSECDPLVVQARLLAGGGTRDPRLDDRFRSPFRTPTEGESAERPERMWPIGAAVAGPGFALRADLLHDGPEGTFLHGRLRPSSSFSFVPYVLAARDDRAQWYVPASESGSGPETAIRWRLVPPLDPAARAIDIVVAGLDGETQVAVPLP